MANMARGKTFFRIYLGNPSLIFVVKKHDFGCLAIQKRESIFGNSAARRWEILRRRRLSDFIQS
jgi:hypothetical protein